MGSVERGSKARSAETYNFCDVILRFDVVDEGESGAQTDGDRGERVDLGAVDRVQVQVVVECSAQSADYRTELPGRHLEERRRSRQNRVIARADTATANDDTKFDIYVKF